MQRGKNSTDERTGLQGNPNDHPQKSPKRLQLRASSSGGRTQNRTGDTRIFSPLLYRLSYPASLRKAALSVCVRRSSTGFFYFLTSSAFFQKSTRFKQNSNKCLSFLKLAS